MCTNEENGVIEKPSPGSFELARLKKGGKEVENRFGDFLVWYFRDGFSRQWEPSWPGKLNGKLS